MNTFSKLGRWLKDWRHVTIAVQAILLLTIGVVLASECLAADKISKIRPITSTESAGRALNIRAEDYFDVVGTLNLIESNRVVIGNTELGLAGGTRTSGVSLYDQVGARLNKKGEVTSIEVISDIPN